MTQPISKAEESRRNKIGTAILVLLAFIIIIAIIAAFCPPPFIN